MPEVVLERLSKRYDSVPAVDDLSLELERGELISLLGPSGCGKTTTLRMLGGFVMPTAGRVLIRGLDVTRQPPHRRDTAMVFQSYALFPHLTVFENVAFGLRRRHVPAADLASRVHGMLELLQLGPLAKRLPRELSGGQQQRVAVGRALVVSPAVLLLDEPFSNLDAKLRASTRVELRRLQQELELTAVFVTHDQEEAMAISDRIVVMNQGTVEQVGTAREIYERPTTRFVADFIGTANVLHARVIDRSGNGLRIEAEGRLELLVDGPPEFLAGSRVAAVIRPEELRVRPADADRHALAPNSAAGRVEVASYLGPVAELNVRLDAGPTMLVRGDNHLATRYTSGARVVLAWDPAAIYLFPD
ncbi:MAG: ABC transporter ATP-binding protein [Chloroflexi bacterium]|nr:ABC transporter ATP-binding protein [Chloroflexota bacterium]